MAVRPTFVLGVGCQKGGTTWLFQYLATHPSVAMSPFKEMHVFDSAFRPDLYSLAPATPQIAAMIADHRAYRSYFLQLATARPVVGEITPSYAVLGADHFAAIRALLEPYFALRVIFLMRDPVDRIWSRSCMQERTNTDSQALQARFRANIDRPEVVARTSYDATIEALEAVFAPGELYYGFYETLFRDESLAAICKFIGIDFMPPNYSRRFNASPRPERPDPATVAVARARYAPVYDFCANRFGADFIASIWPNA